MLAMLSRTLRENRVKQFLHVPDSSLLATHIETVRTVVHDLRASGDMGFEGLIATVLAEITGLQIRLAKSGSQFGRDASSPRDIFTIAIEAKRYNDRLQLDDLLGKAVSASEALGGDTDLWIVAATSEAGDDTVRKVTAAVERTGMSALFLDWSSRPLPPLAVALACMADKTIQWFADFHPSIDREPLRIALGTVRTADAFAASERRLRESLASAEVGFHAFRLKNAAWLRERWSDRLLSQSEFDQVILPLDAENHVLAGRAERGKFKVTLLDARDCPVTVVLGDEGVGKTWLIADWWLGLENRPILIPVLGRSIEELDTRNPFEALANLVRLHYNQVECDTASWRRRLSRWASRDSTAAPWIVLVFDGLNEHPDQPWASLINSFGRTVSKLGGALVVTCRPGFWKREVEPRLSTALKFREFNLGEYDPGDVDELLVERGHSPDALSGSLRRFLRNARVCSVALNLLSQLGHAPGELSIERLQLEYWRQRMRERANLVRLNASEFHNILRVHAREWISGSAKAFVLEDAPTKSKKPQAMLHDLSEIVEGRFMNVHPSDENVYEFRPEALPFALALLLNQALRSAARTSVDEYTEEIEVWLEPINGFGKTSSIVAAALSLACLEEGFPEPARTSLIKYWSSIQNLNEDSIDAMVPNILLQPLLFCDALEWMDKSPGYFSHQNELEQLLFLQADNSRVRAALDEKLPVWFNRWCRKNLPFPGQQNKENLDREEVQQKLLSLSFDEQEEFRRRCQELADPRAVHIDELAAFLLFAGPVEAFAESIWSWCLSQAMARDIRSAHGAMHLAVALNPYDWKATAVAIRTLVGHVSRTNSEPHRRAASKALRLLGDRASAVEAEVLSGPLQGGGKWRAVSRYCEVNPHDPNVTGCKNLPVAIEELQGIPGVSIRRERQSYEEDIHFGMVIPALARFRPDPLICKIREMVASIEVREGRAQEALCWEMVEYSAALDGATIAAVERALFQFLRTTTTWNPDSNLVVDAMLRTIFPHLSAARQLELLLQLPVDMTLFLSVQGTFARPEVEEFEAALDKASSSSNPSSIERVLFVASGQQITLSLKAKELVKTQLANATGSTRNVAYDVVWNAGDQELDELVLTEAERDGFDARTSDDYYRAEAITRAVIRSGRPARLPLVIPRLRQAAAAQMGDEAIVRIADDVERDIKRLLQPISISADLLFSTTVHASPDGLKQRIGISPDDVEEGIAAFVDPEASARRFNETQKRRVEQLRVTEQALAEEGASALRYVPSHQFLIRLVELAPERVAGWLQLILSARDERILNQISNLGSGLAGAYAKVDGALAASVLQSFLELESKFPISVDSEQIPLYLSAVFAESEAIEMDTLRDMIVERATNDAQLELFARAASTCRARTWLLGYIHRHHADEHPGMRARAVVLAGFCSTEDDVSYVYSDSLPTGFLAEAQRYSLKQRTRAKWAEHWCHAAVEAESTIDLWRFCRLAEGVVDRRFIRCFEDLDEDWRYRLFLPELYDRLRKAAKERSKKRESTLFGIDAPVNQVLWAVRQRQRDSGKRK